MMSTQIRLSSLLSLLPALGGRVTGHGVTGHSPTRGRGGFTDNGRVLFRGVCHWWIHGGSERRPVHPVQKARLIRKFTRTEGFKTRNEAICRCRKKPLPAHAIRQEKAPSPSPVTEFFCGSSSPPVASQVTSSAKKRKRKKENTKLRMIVDCSFIIFILSLVFFFIGWDESCL